MFAINTYEEIEQRQRENGDKQIVILLFVRPTVPGAKEIIEEFDYIHYNSERYCSIYAVGYSNDFRKPLIEAINERQILRGVSGFSAMLNL